MGGEGGGGGLTEDRGLGHGLGILTGEDGGRGYHPSGAIDGGGELWSRAQYGAPRGAGAEAGEFRGRGRGTEDGAGGRLGKERMRLTLVLQAAMSVKLISVLYIYTINHLYLCCCMGQCSRNRCMSTRCA